MTTVLRRGGVVWGVLWMLAGGIAGAQGPKAVVEAQSDADTVVVEADDVGW